MYFVPTTVLVVWKRGNRLELMADSNEWRNFNLIFENLIL
jgi:hypothetical protein